MENPENVEWQAPPPPEKIVNDPPQMSEVSTLFGIFFEPGRTFEDLKRKPRFILGFVLIALLVTAFSFGLGYKVGDAGMRRFIAEQLEKNPQTANLSGEQKSQSIDLQMTIQNYARYGTPIFLVIIFLLGGLLYWAAAKAFGGTGGFLHALSVFVYSSIPPTVISMIGGLIVMAFKSADEIDIATSQRGLLHANPSIFIDGKAQPVLATLISTLDVFMIWGWILAAIGLRITNKLSSGSAWAIVIIFALLGILGRVVGAYFSGNPA